MFYVERNRGCDSTWCRYFQHLSDRSNVAFDDIGVVGVNEGAGVRDFGQGRCRNMVFFDACIPS